MQHHNLRLEIKALGPREFEGYGSVFGNVDHGGDVVVPGAFAKSIADHKADGSMPLMFWMHQADQVPGVWTDMAEDAKGLYVKGEIVDTALGRDVRTLLSKNAVRGLSIGYRPVDTDWRQDGTRVLKAVELFEVSIVSMAMNPLARVEAMKAARLSADGEYVPSERELERMFMTCGCSLKTAKTLISRILKEQGVPQQLPEDDQMVLAAIHALTDRIGAQALSR